MFRVIFYKFQAAPILGVAGLQMFRVDNKKLNSGKGFAMRTIAESDREVPKTLKCSASDAW